MSKIISSIFQLILLVVFYSCKPTLPLNYRLEHKAGLPINPSWTKELVTYSDSVKFALSKFFSNDFGYFNGFLKTHLSETEIKKIIYTPANSYILDSISFSEYNSSKNFIKQLKLDNYNSWFYGMLFGENVVDVEMRKNNNAWAVRSIGEPMSNSKHIANLIENKFPIVTIEVKYNKVASKFYTAYINSKNEIIDLVYQKPIQESINDFHKSIYQK